MITRPHGQFLCALTWIATMPLARAAAPDISGLQTLLQRAGLDRKSQAGLQGGKVVTELLETRRDSEVACLGAAVIAVPREYFLSQFRDIGNFKKGPGILQVGTVSPSPSVSDLRKLTLSLADIDALKKCWPGHCNMKLSALMMEQIRRGLNDSSTAAARRSGDSVFRGVLVDYLRRYLAAGNQALACYADESPPVCLARELAELLGEYSLLREYAPVLYERLSGDGQAQKDGPESFLYWSEEKFGPLKPVWTVTQVIIYLEEREGVRWSFVASKQIYANHYFRASLGLTVLVDAGQDNLLMIYLNRSRVDGLGGWLGAVKRAIVRHKLRSGMQKNVALIRTRLERSYRQSDGRH